MGVCVCVCTFCHPDCQPAIQPSSLPAFLATCVCVSWLLCIYVAYEMIFIVNRLFYMQVYASLNNFGTLQSPSGHPRSSQSSKNPILFHFHRYVPRWQRQKCLLCLLFASQDLPGRVAPLARRCCCCLFRHIKWLELMVNMQMSVESSLVFICTLEQGYSKKDLNLIG